MSLRIQYIGLSEKVSANHKNNVLMSNLVHMRARILVWTLSVLFTVTAVDVEKSSLSTLKKTESKLCKDATRFLKTCSEYITWQMQYVVPQSSLGLFPPTFNLSLNNRGTNGDTSIACSTQYWRIVLRQNFLLSFLSLLSVSVLCSIVLAAFTKEPIL